MERFLKYKDFLKKLLETPGASGFESNIRELMEEELKIYVDEITTDKVGNLIFIKYGNKEDSPKILLMAHMDEIGLIIKHIDDSGFIYFSYLGGINSQVLLNQRVLISGKNGTVLGVVGSKSIHLMNEKERKEPIRRDQMYIDVGADSLEEVLNLGIRVGDPATWIGELHVLNNNKICGKAIDGRIGLLILAEVIKSLDVEPTIIGIASIMEEVGLRGASTATYNVDSKYNIDFGISLDISLAGDYPGVNESISPIKLGAGPTITVASGTRTSLQNGLIAHPKIRGFLTRIAEEFEIPYQLEVMEGGTTDGANIMLTREGIPTSNIGVPCRYAHSPVEVVSLNDVDNTIKLIQRALENTHKLIVF
ncbi:MAG: M42 family metallopeptidase [Candidatus Helarchaeota archaeon]